MRRRDADLIHRVNHGKSKGTKVYHLTVYIPKYRLDKNKRIVDLQKVAATFQDFHRT